MFVGKAEFSGCASIPKRYCRATHLVLPFAVLVSLGGNLVFDIFGPGGATRVTRVAKLYRWENGEKPCLTIKFEEILCSAKPQKFGFGETNEK